MNTVRQNNRDVDPERVSARGKVRRMVITLTTKALWQVAGVVLGRGGEQEAYSAEPFGGIGVFARPPSSGKPEAIVALLGNDGKTPIIVAIRDEKTRQAIASALLEDETMIFTSKVCTHHRADGTIELRNGTPASTVEKMVKGESQRDALKDFADAAKTIIDAIILTIDALNTAAPTLTGSPGQVAAYTTAETALKGAQKTAFDNAVTTLKTLADNWLATVGKVE